MNTSNKEITREVTGTQLAPLIEFTLKGGDDALDLVRDALNRELRNLAEGQWKFPHRAVEMAQLQAWLHPDPRKRIEPQFGMGFLLLKVAGLLLTPVTNEKSKRKKQHE